MRAAIAASELREEVEESTVFAMLRTLGSRFRPVKRKDGQFRNTHSFRTSRTASDQSAPDFVRGPVTDTSCPTRSATRP